MRLFASIAAGCVIALAPLTAATLQRLSLAQMVQKSTAIVRTTVQSCTPESHGPVIYTRCRLSVSEWWKGASGSIATVMVPGGAANGLQETFAGAPTLVEGREYVLFLWTGRSGNSQIIGLSQGLFDLKLLQGQLVAQHDPSTETVVDSSGSSVQDSFVQMGLPAFKAKVLSLVSAGGSK